MKITALVGLACVLFSSQGDALDGEEKKQDCVESCKEGKQERLGDYCYYWSTARKSWDDSELHCQGEGGHLAAVTSLEIQNFLLGKVNTLDSKTWFWIGGSKKGQQGKWEWIDGSVWNFTHWANQPSQQPSGWGENCLQIYHHVVAQNGWNDRKCSNFSPFICSWRICQGSIFRSDGNPYICTAAEHKYSQS